jgi:hypothetical protein
MATSQTTSPTDARLIKLGDIINRLGSVPRPSLAPPACSHPQAIRVNPDLREATTVKQPASAGSSFSTARALPRRPHRATGSIPHDGWHTAECRKGQRLGGGY